MEHRSARTIRVWAEILDDFDEPAGPYIDVVLAELPDMLRAAQQDLIAFLDPLRDWAHGVAPDLTDTFVTRAQLTDRFLAAIDTGLGITAPLVR